AEVDRPAPGVLGGRDRGDDEDDDVAGAGGAAGVEAEPVEHDRDQDDPAADPEDPGDEAVGEADRADEDPRDDQPRPRQPHRGAEADAGQGRGPAGRRPLAAGEDPRQPDEDRAVEPGDDQAGEVDLAAGDRDRAGVVEEVEDTGAGVDPEDAAAEEEDVE